MKLDAINQIQWECQQLLNKVTMLMDNNDWEALANCYTQDGILFRPSDPHNGVEGREAILASFLARPPRTTCHIISNCTFNVLDPETVEAQSRVWLVTGPAADRLPVIADSTLLVGSFSDEIVKENGRWLLNKRQGGIELKFQGTLPA